jgi:flagellar hook assembly protein FlgD
LDELKIYPNPVRPGYTGLITIDGLIRDALIKITDISGNLVYETYSNGGRATWNGKTANGQQVGNGIYLVLVATNDGSQKIAGKIAIVN